jgi:polyisoprenoid-binding protein YceI
MLVRHLESDDFFSVADHPTATFRITDLTPIPDAFPGQPNHVATGTLTLRGVTNEVSFRARVAPHREGGLALQARFDLDRTRWGSLYGSGRFFARLGMHLVDDAVSLDVHVRTN